MTLRIRSWVFLMIAAIAAAFMFGTGTPLRARSEGQVAVLHGANGTPASSQPKNATGRGEMMYLDHAAGEPTFGFTKDGHIFYTASDGCLTSCAGSSQSADIITPGSRVVVMSADGGKTWEDRSPKAGPAWTHVFSLDPMIYVDPETNRIFDSDLNVACSHISFTDDQGKTWTESPVGCGEPVNDHQTLFAGPAPKGSAQPFGQYPRVTYYCINHPAFTRCDKSLDGGQTWIPSGNLEPPDCSGLNGHGVTDRKGIIYLPMGANCRTPQLAISADEGDTWTQAQPGGNLREAGGDPSVAVDKNGNLYYLFTERTSKHAYLFISRDHAKHWSKPIDVTAPGVQETNLATLDVGDPGKVAIAYYGTTNKGATWNGYIAAGKGLLTSNPVFLSAVVNDPAHPLKIDACGPGRCGRVLDFIDANVSPDGRAYGSYVDACLQVCEKTGEEQITDNQGVIGVLRGGFRLR